MDPNSTLPPVLEGLAHSLNSVVNIAQVLVGGIFGLYVILIILRWHEARTLKRLMKEVRDELRKLNKKK